MSHRKNAEPETYVAVRRFDPVLTYKSRVFISTGTPQLMYSEPFSENYSSWIFFKQN